MQYLPISLFLAGLFVIVVAVLGLFFKIFDGKKIGFIIPILLISGIAFSVAGLALPKLQNSTVANAGTAVTPAKGIQSTPNTITSTTKSSTQKTTSIESQGTISSANNQIKFAPFDPNGSVVPKTSSDNDIITDADGSKTLINGMRGNTFITSDGIRFQYDKLNLQTHVDVPDGQSFPDGKHYTSYSYSVDGTDGEIYVGEDHFATTNLIDGAIKYLDQGKTYTYPPNSEYSMSPIDFIYKYISINNPKTTVKNTFLSGSYYCKETSPLATNTTASLTIHADDNLLDFETSYISNLGSGMYGYKLEPLGKNAYKLYLYNTTVKPAANGGGVSVSDDPLKRTFIIYRTGPDSFNLVFISDNLARMSLSMSKE